MAGTTTSSYDNLGLAGAIRDTTVQLNKLVDDIEILRAAVLAVASAHNTAMTKLDADAGVTDTNYAATLTVDGTTFDTAGDLTAAKVGVRGTAIT